MNKILASLFIISYGFIYSHPCTPGAQNYGESSFIRTGLTTMGDLWTAKDLTSGGLEYPKRTSQEMVNGIRAIYPRPSRCCHRRALEDLWYGYKIHFLKFNFCFLSLF